MDSMKMKRMIFWIAGLTVIDQGVKLVIARFLMEAEFTILPGILYFQTMQNIHRGAIPYLLDWMMPVHIAVLISIIVMSIIVIAYRCLKYLWHRFIHKFEKYKNILDIWLVLYLSPFVCKLIDDVFWGGSLVFIHLFEEGIIVDIKEIYHFAGSILLISYYVAYLSYYFKLSKEERRKEGGLKRLLQWIKSGLPMKPTD